MGSARVDLHVKVFDDRVRALARRRDLDAVVYAPHYTPWPEIVSRAKAATSDELVVVPGREIFTGPWHDRKHVLALDLEAPIPDFIPLSEVMARLVDQDACVLAPHPAYLSISLSAAEIERYRDVILAVERLNPKYLPWHGPRAERIATRVDRPGFASSYAHLRSSVGAAWTELEVHASSVESVIDAIRAGRISDVHRAGGGRYRRTALAEIAHLAYENSVEKARRVLGPGLEATHPERPLYRDGGQR